MAKSTSRPPRKPTPISSNVGIEDAPPDIQGDIPPAFNPAFNPPAAEAPAETASRHTEAKPSLKTPTFFQTINKIPKADWGARANIYLYRVEPVIDRTRSGDTKFVNTYAEPVNEDRIMADYGSGRYKLMLNFRKAGADMGDLLDSVYIDILNMKYPPKIPLGEWVDDPRNKKWAWAKEASASPAVPAVPPPTGVETFVDVLRATGDIRREIREEMQDNAPTTASLAAVDPWSAAEKILNMRSENPMVAILQQQMKDAAAATESERTRAFTAAEAAREREFKLQEKLLEARTANPAEKPKTFIEQMNDFKTLKDLFTSNGIGEAVRAGRTTALDVTRDIASKFFESDLATGVGQWLGSLAQKNVGAPVQVMNGATPPAVQQPSDGGLMAFIEQVINPALLRQYSQGFTGSDFAGWLHDAFPARLLELQNFQHPRIPGLRGASAIVQAYKHTPAVWNALMAMREGEQALVAFVTEFCAWKPEDAIDVEPIEPHSDSEPEEGPERI